MKKLTFTISLPTIGISKDRTFTLNIKDDANIVEALAMVDKYVSEHPHESVFPLYGEYIHYYLQLIVNVEKDFIYEDVAIYAYGPNREFMPIRENLHLSLIPNSEISLIPDSEC